MFSDEFALKKKFVGNKFYNVSYPNYICADNHVMVN
jgi:hypothetical protein